MIPLIIFLAFTPMALCPDIDCYDDSTNIFWFSETHQKMHLLETFYDYPNWVDTFWYNYNHGWVTNDLMGKVIDFAVDSNQVKFQEWKWKIAWKQYQNDLKFKEAMNSQ